ncbi:MAG TPA: DUF4230 domain-containing protein [Clostridia bacterium]|jgi:hypothetical protein|nr:DUF4230 domain-containing protein [Clostridia bacterium]
MFKQLRKLGLAYILGLICGIFLFRVMPVPPAQAHVVRERLAKVARLTTVEYRFEQLVVFDDRLSVELFGQQMEIPGTAKQISALVVGKVRAGIDLGKLGNDAIKVEHRKIEVELPEAEVFGIEIDYKETKVFDEKTGLFRRIFDNNELDLAKIIINKGCEEGMARALEGGLLSIGTENGKQILRQILERTGFEEIIFN